MLSSRIRIVSALSFCFSGSCSTAFAQVDLFEPELTGRSFIYRAIVVQQVERELNCMRLVANLTVHQADNIRKKLAGLIDEESARLQNADTSAMSRDSKAIRDAIGVEAHSVLGAKELKAFNDDLTLRIDFHRRAAQRAVLVSMDRLLSLSSKQEGAIAELLIAEWTDKWNGEAMHGAQGGLIAIRKQLKELPEKKLKATLRESQWAAVEGMMTLATTPIIDPQGIVGLSKLRGQAISMLRLEEMTELCKLSDNQSGKLQEALAAAVSESVRRKGEAWRALRGRNMEGTQAIRR